LYVTGLSGVRIKGRENAVLISDYATIAYRTATGARRWIGRYNGPGNGDDVAVGLAVSPVGGRVFVTGASQGVRSGYDFATIGYHG
jgi:DNA-binding beta-propeller fold protein YncE